MKKKTGKAFFWFNRISFAALILIFSILANVDSWKSLNLNGLGMMTIFAIFIIGFYYIAWTKPKEGGWIILILGIFWVIKAATDKITFDWNFFASGIPMIIIGTSYLLEGYTITKM